MYLPSDTNIWLTKMTSEPRGYTLCWQFSVANFFHKIFFCSLLFPGQVQSSWGVIPEACLRMVYEITPRLPAPCWQLYLPPPHHLLRLLFSSSHPKQIALLTRCSGFSTFHLSTYRIQGHSSGSSTPAFLRFTWRKRTRLRSFIVISPTVPFKPSTILSQSYNSQRKEHT